MHAIESPAIRNTPFCSEMDEQKHTALFSVNSTARNAVLHMRTTSKDFAGCAGRLATRECNAAAGRCRIHYYADQVTPFHLQRACPHATKFLTGDWNTADKGVKVLESGSQARPKYRAAHRNFIGGPAGLLLRSDQGNPLLLGTPQHTSAIS